MTRQDWLTACVVALFVAVLTMAVAAPPVCWAEPDTPAAVPALPSVDLTLPSIHARVSALAIPAPGEPVEVTLAVTPISSTGTPAGNGSDPAESSAAEASAVTLPGLSGTVLLQDIFGESVLFRSLFAHLTPVLYHVPVTVTVLKTEMNPMARSMPEPEQVMQLETSVPVNPGGAGSAIVPLPLTWAEPEKPAVNVADGNNRQQVLRIGRTLSYQLVLSSLLGEKAAPSELRQVSQADQRVTEKRL